MMKNITNYTNYTSNLFTNKADKLKSKEQVDQLLDKLPSLNFTQKTHLLKLIKSLAIVAINNSRSTLFNPYPKINISNEKLITFIQALNFTAEEAKTLICILPSSSSSGELLYSAEFTTFVNKLSTRNILQQIIRTNRDVAVKDASTHLISIGIVTGGVSDDTMMTANSSSKTAIPALPKIHRGDLVSIYESNLSGLNLSRTDLSNCDLSKFNLTDTILIDAILNGANLSESNLTKARLLRAELTNVNMTDTNLSNAHFAKTDLRSVTFNGATLCNVNMFCANLTRVNLAGLDMTNAIFNNAIMNGSDLNQANLTNTNFHDTDLTDADLTGATITACYLNGTDLTNANLTNTKTTLRLCEYPDDDCNHLKIKYLGELRGRSTLTAINSIDDKYQDLKINLMQQVVTHLQNKNISRIIPALIDFREKNPIFKNLTKEMFSGTNLHNAYMVDQSLTGTTLADLDLTSANLQHTKLDNADLTNTNLTDCNLRGTNLTGANLTNTKITLRFSKYLDLDFDHLKNPNGTILTAINSIDDKYQDLKINLMRQVITHLHDENISKIIPALIDIFCRNPIYTDLRKEIFSGKKLHQAYLVGTALAGVNLAGLDLTGARLEHAKIDGSNLNGITLTYANLSETELTNVDLTDANLTDCNLRGTNLAGANLTNTQITLKFSLNLDLDFNHLNNQSGSILTAINSIDDKYQDLKINLMLQAINHLKTTPNFRARLNEIIPPLTDILGKNPVYLTNPEIKSFAFNAIMPFYDTKGTKLEQLPDRILKFFLSTINSLEDGSEESTISLQGYLREKNSFFVQLYYWSQKSSTTEVQEVGKLLQEKYLTLPEVAAVKDHYENMDLWEDHKTLIFINTEKKSALVMPPTYLDRNLHGKKITDVNELRDSDWNNCSYYLNNTLQDLSAGRLNSRPALDEIFESFPIFQNPYAFVQNQATFSKLIGLLKLGNLEEHFLKAIKVHSYATKMITAGYQNQLGSIFEKFIIDGNNKDKNKIAMTGNAASDIRLTTEHSETILATYRIGNNRQKQAELFLCLATIFAKYSSSYIFGNENNSPVPIRNYALALLNKAVELAPQMITTETVNDWKNRFTGVKFSCSAIIFNGMRPECERIAPATFNSILPPAWS